MTSQTLTLIHFAKALLVQIRKHTSLIAMEMLPVLGGLIWELSGVAFTLISLDRNKHMM